jgi:tartrate dehydratase beta subunit/fumarate hydratase class I family protein
MDDLPMDLLKMVIFHSYSSRKHVGPVSVGLGPTIGNHVREADELT